MAVIASFSMCLMTLSAGAQTAAGSSTSGNASITPGQASAGASTSQSAQTPGTSANVDGSANAKASHEHESKKQGKESGSSGSKSSSNSPATNGGSAISSGTTLQAELTRGLDCKKAKPGDEVSAKLTQDVKSDGKVVLHKGSKLMGHVTEAQAKSKENTESKLGIVFDKAVLKGGQEMAFNGAIQALAPRAQGSLSAAADESANIAGSGMARGGNMGGARTTAPIGGAVGSTVGAATNTVGNTAGSVTGAAGATVNNTAGTAVNGTINSTSHGVVGMQGLSLATAAIGNAQGSVISSATHNVKLDAGTQMVLQVVAAH